jgi:hypothetical protein
MGNDMMVRRATRQAEKPVARSAQTPARAKPATASKSIAQAKTAKPKSDAAKIAGPKLAGLSSDQKVVVLLRDREMLIMRLQAAEARVAELEAREEQLSDRISWALDTLNDLLRLPDAS